MCFQKGLLWQVRMFYDISIFDLDVYFCILHAILVISGSKFSLFWGPKCLGFITRLHGMCVWSWSKHSGWYTVFEPRRSLGSRISLDDKNIRKMRRVGVHHYMYSLFLSSFFMLLHLICFILGQNFLVYAWNDWIFYVNVDLSPSSPKKRGFSRTGVFFTQKPETQKWDAIHHSARLKVKPWEVFGFYLVI